MASRKSALARAGAATLGGDVQQWKQFDQKANKNGPHHTVFWVTRNNQYDENKKLVTAITTGDVKGIVAAQMKSQEGSIQEVTSGIWSTLKIAALVVLGIMCIPLFITRSNTKKINAICEETKNGKSKKALGKSK